MERGFAFLNFPYHYAQETYNASQEVERKRALAAVLSQTRLQERKDAEVCTIIIPCTI